MERVCDFMKRKLKDRKGIGVVEALVIMIMLVLFILTCIDANASEDTYINPQYIGYCEQIGAQYAICPEVLEAMIETESSGNPLARNGRCCGLMQVDAQIHAGRMQRLGVSDIFEPRGNILVAADFFAESFETYGDDFAKILMIYNGTKGAKDKAARGDFTDYARKIMKRAERLEKLHGK